MAAQVGSPLLKTKLSQDDFDSLVVPEQSEDPLYDTYDTYSPKSPELSQKKTPETYVPVNFIPEAVYAMIEAWEQSELKKQDMMDASGSVTMATPASLSGGPSLNDYEPVRICNFAAPPKRFYRTFWRSIARRVLESDKSAVYEQVRA